MFEVSVIIPVYNAEKYITRAIKSIIDQPYVGEVIVVDDGYPDGALGRCLHLEEEYTKLKVLRHPNGENRGAGASRNLGMKHAKFPFIAFLDADDYCLEGRFLQTKEAFERHLGASVVYEAVGTAYENDKAKQQFCDWRKIPLEEADHYITDMDGNYQGRMFLKELLQGRKGAPCTLGITIKRDFLNIVKPWFKENLRLHQDSEFWARLAYYGDFYPTDSRSPIAMRWVHLENRIAGRSYESAYLKEKELFDWAKSNCEDTEIRRLIAKRYIYARTQRSFQASNRFVLLCCKIRYLFFIRTNSLFF